MLSPFAVIRIVPLLSVTRLKLRNPIFDATKNKGLDFASQIKNYVRFNFSENVSCKDLALAVCANFKRNEAKDLVDYLSKAISSFQKLTFFAFFC